MNKVLNRGLATSGRLLAKAVKQETAKPILGRPSNNLSLGVVGLANVGKSTFFQSITKTNLGIAANYPFATIDPSKSLVTAESPELEKLAELYGLKKKIPSSLTIYDIAGLTRNAASGAGLGNKFLADIRMVDGIFHVVRGFRNDDIVHIEEGEIDPVRDLVIVNDELILKDIEFVESALEKSGKHSYKPGFSDDVSQVLNKVQDFLYEGKKISVGDWSSNEVEIINKYNFITAKPTVYLLNVSEADFLNQTNEFHLSVQEWIDENCPQDHLLMFLAQYESKIIEENLALDKSANNLIINTMRKALRLISFYTCGPKEAHQWTVRENSLAPDAAQVIHNDLKDTFISAQAYKYQDLVHEQAPLNEASLKSKGKLYRYGKNQPIEDGDVLVIKAAAAKKR